jgi:hypothetical protein
MWLVVSGREKIGCLSGFRTSLCGQVLFNPNFSERQIAGSHGNRFVVNSLVTCNFNCLYVVIFFVAAYKIVLSLYCITTFHVVSTYLCSSDTSIWMCVKCLTLIWWFSVIVVFGVGVFRRILLWLVTVNFFVDSLDLEKRWRRV